MTPPPTSLSVTRQGGDTYASALPIPSILFSATGSTVGYTNDYAVGCGFDDELAPDVVYSIVPPATGYYVIDLCGSEYDVKLAVSDVNGNVIACNDDDDYMAGSGDPCVLDSRLEDIYLDVHNCNRGRACGTGERRGRRDPCRVPDRLRHRSDDRRRHDRRL